MAKITDYHLLAWHGSPDNKTQMFMAIPGGGDANTGGSVFLEAVDASGDPNGGMFLFTDGTDLRISATKPTNTNTGGSALGTASSSNANRELSNLNATAVNTSIISDADSTDNLGSSSYYWAATYTDALYLNATAYLDGTTAAGETTVTGNFNFGVDDTGVDVVFYGATSGSKITWDESADSLLVTDSTPIKIGDSADVTLQWDGTDLELDFAAANSAVQFGNTNPSDLVLHGATAGYDIQWDASADSLIALDNAVIAFGSGSDVTFVHDGTDLSIDGGAANTIVRIGDNTTIDLYLHGATYDAYWDASADRLQFNDSANLAFGSSNDVTILWDATDLEIDFAAANSAVQFGATNPSDFVLHGATAGRDVQWDASDDALEVLDNAAITIGTGADISLLWDGTDGELDFAAANSMLNIGQTNASDVTIFGNGSEVIWDASADTLTVMDSGILAFGDADDVTITWDGSTLDLDMAAANGIFNIGATTATDFVLHGATASADATWDASADTLTFAAGATLVVTGATAGDGTTGLEIPYHATASPSGTPGTGSIMFEVDANKLWVYNGSSWVGAVLS